MKNIKFDIEKAVINLSGYEDVVLEEKTSKLTGDTRFYIFKVNNSNDLLSVMTEPNYAEIQSKDKGLLFSGSMKELNDKIEGVLEYLDAENDQ